MSQHLEEDGALDLILELLPRDREQELLAHVAVCGSCEELMRQQAAEMERLASNHAAAVRLGSNSAPDLRPQATPGPSASAKRSGGLIERLLGGGWPGGRLLPLGGLAAGLAVFFFFLTARQQSVPAALEANWLPSAGAIVQRQAGSDGAATDALAAGLDAYGRRDLAAAIRSLEKASVSRELDGFRRLYLGSALALEGEYPRAVAILRPVRVDVLPEPWGTEGYWTLLVALERGGQRASADSLRRVLSERPGEISERVARLSTRTR